MLILYALRKKTPFKNGVFFHFVLLAELNANIYLDVLSSKMIFLLNEIVEKKRVNL